MAQTIDYKGSRFEVSMVARGYSIHRYSVRLAHGEWPTDDELISLCDKGNGALKSDFGGQVSKLGSSAGVCVYVD